MTYILVIFVLLLSLGQLLFKQVGLLLTGRPLVPAFVMLMHQPTFYAALVLYGGATLLWVWILSRITLMQAYPWIALGTIIVPLIGLFVFGEKVGAFYWPGVALIVCGFLLTQYSSGAS